MVIEAGDFEDGLRASLELAPSYLAGFPMLALVHVVNDNPWTTFHGVPRPRLFSSSHMLEIEWRRGDERIVSECAHREGGPRGALLRPNGSLSAVIDLSLGATELEPGEWEVDVRWPIADMEIESTARVCIERAEPERVRAAQEVRSANSLGVDEWYAFALARREPIDDEVRASIGDTLGLHLFVRDAIHGPHEIAALDDAALLKTSGPAEVEAALFRHEILSARGAPFADGIANAILERWPGAQARIEETREGDGMLARLRAVHR
jgi:hypothetical protein